MIMLLVMRTGQDWCNLMMITITILLVLVITVTIIITDVTHFHRL